ncbi:GNAT family N-acetyltransferase [Nocardioides dilutus]
MSTSSDAATAPTGHLDLRPVRADDRAFLVALYGSTRDAELSQVAWEPGQREAFIEMQFAAQDVQYRAHNPNGAFDVIEVDGEPVGRLYVDRRPGDIRIVDISVVPQRRGAGIGSRLIGGLQEEAAATFSCLSIHVEVHNPAATLYERLGFVEVSERGVYRLMEWRP